MSEKYWRDEAAASEPGGHGPGRTNADLTQRLMSADEGYPRLPVVRALLQASGDEAGALEILRRDHWAESGTRTERVNKTYDATTDAQPGSAVMHYDVGEDEDKDEDEDGGGRRSAGGVEESKRSDRWARGGEDGESDEGDDSSVGASSLGSIYGEEEVVDDHEAWRQLKLETLGYSDTESDTGGWLMGVATAPLRPA